MLRRSKNEVLLSLPPKKEIHVNHGLTKLQVNIYINLSNKKVPSKSSAYKHNLLMQLRKICCHPYLFEDVEDSDLPVTGDHLINSSGNMIVLHKLLLKLKKKRDSAKKTLSMSTD